MILFANVFLTDKTSGLRYERALLPDSRNRVDVFHYALASLAPLPWSAVVIYYDMAPSLQHRRAELDASIRALFPQAQIHPFQNENQRQWQAAVSALDAIDDDLVWFCCNDDHVFLDYESGLLARIEQTLRRKLPAQPLLACMVTHLPECLTGLPLATEITPDFFSVPSASCNSMQIVSKGVLRAWWFDTDYGDAWMPRTDAVRNSRSVTSPMRETLVPFRELVRHYDGYGHIGIDLNLWPPLTIPPGFFEKEINLQFGGPERIPGRVWIDPHRPYSSAVHPQGADLHLVPDDLPLFWRGRIRSSKKFAPPDDPAALYARNLRIVHMARQCHPVPVTHLRIALRIPPDEIEENYLARLEEEAIQLRLHQSYRDATFRRTQTGVDAIQELIAWYDRLGIPPEQRTAAPVLPRPAV